MRTGLATLGAVLVLLAGCGGGDGGDGGGKGEGSKPKDPIETVRSYLSAVFEADGAAACELLNKDLRQEAAKTVRTLRLPIEPSCEAFIEDAFKKQKEGNPMLFEGDVITAGEVEGLALKIESKDATAATVGTGPDGTQKFELEKVGGQWRLSDVAGIPVTL